MGKSYSYRIIMIIIPNIGRHYFRLRIILNTLPILIHLIFMTTVDGYFTHFISEETEAQRS